MNVIVLNKSLTPIKIIDTFESLIWTDRYCKCGDFELYTPITSEILAYIKQDYYLQIKDSEHLMIIEKIQISSDAEEGDHLTVSGRSLESILDRRIIWKRKRLSGNLQNGIETLLNECIISPSISRRQIDNFIFTASTDTRITSLTVSAEYTGDNLYDVISELCEKYGLGFKITLNADSQFVFKLYIGDDRSYSQSDNPYVVFSPTFENIINSNYLESKASLKNLTLIGGEGEGSARIYTTTGSAKGLDRRELFTDARDISSDTDDGGTLKDWEYKRLLKQRGKEKLAENIAITSFEGEAETSIMFQYGIDFFMGDIVQIANEYGHEMDARITEVVNSTDDSGHTVYPTFEAVIETAEGEDEED